MYFPCMTFLRKLFSLKKEVYTMSLALPAYMVAMVAYPAQLISFGRLEAVFTGFLQVGLVIGIVIFVLGIFLAFFPGAKKFLGGLLT